MLYQVIPKKAKGEKPIYVCAICAKQGKRDLICGQNDFGKHVREEHKGFIVICDCCDFMAKNLQGLAKHRFGSHKKVTGDLEILLCPRDGCAKQYVTKSSLNNHIKMSHDKRYTPGVCPICGETFVNKSSINYHIQQVHDKVRKYECDQCDKKYQTHLNLKHHKVSAHGEDAEMIQAVCETCGKVCSNKYVMHQHVRRVHMKEKQYSCSVCGKPFFGQAQMLMHQRAVHQKGSEFLCPQCGMHCSSAHKLKTHIEHSHLNKRRFRCKTCDSCKPFPTQSHSTNGMFINYSVLFLGFTDSRTLARHIAVRHLGISWKEAGKAESINLARATNAFEKVKEEDAKMFDPVKRARQKNSRTLSDDEDSTKAID